MFKMLRYATILVLFSIIPLRSAMAEDMPLTNEDIMKLVEAKLPVSVIRAKIASSKTDFDVSTDALIGLSQADVPNEIIEAMTLAGKVIVGKQASSDNPDLNFLGTPCKQPGIFFAGAGGDLQAIKPEPIASVVQSAGLLAQLTFGAATARQKAVLENAYAEFRVKQPKPIFWFCLGKLERSSLATEFHPDKVNLLSFQQKLRRKQRLFNIGRINAWSGFKSGVSPKEIVPLSYEQVGDSGVAYKATVKDPLPPAEYGFYFDPGASSALPLANNAPVFTFGVDLPADQDKDLEDRKKGRKKERKSRKDRNRNR